MRACSKNHESERRGDSAQICASQRRWVPGARGRQAKHREIQSGASRLLVGATRSSSHRPSPPRGSGRQKPITFSGTSKTRGEEKPFIHFSTTSKTRSRSRRMTHHRRSVGRITGAGRPRRRARLFCSVRVSATWRESGRRRRLWPRARQIKDKDTRVSATVSSPPRDDRWTPTNGVARVEPLKAPNKKRTDGQSRRRRRFFPGKKFVM